MKIKIWSIISLFLIILCISIGSAQVQNLVINQIPTGGLIFQGEKNLSVIECTKYGGQIFPFVLGMNPDTGALISIKIDNPDDYSVTNTGFAGPVNFYLAINSTQYFIDSNGNKILAFTITVPSLKNTVISADDCGSTGSSTYYRGQLMRFAIITNLAEISNRLDYAKYNGYVNFDVTTPDGDILTELMTMKPETGSVEEVPTTLLDVNVNDPISWYWPRNDCPTPPYSCVGWWTEWRISTTGQESDYKYKLGNYNVKTQVSVNGLAISDDLNFNLAEKPLNIATTYNGVPTSTVNRRDAKFTATITGLPAHKYQIFIYDDCPPKLTGKICDRPPFILGDRAALRAKNVFLDDPDPQSGTYLIGQKTVVDCCKEGTTIRQSVPSGDVYPSKGDWEILEDGTRYYAEVTTTCINNIGTASIDFWVDTTVKPGSSFTIQVQDENSGQKAETNVTINPGPMTISMTDTHDNANGNVFYLNDELKIEGTNSDSNTTYMWLTGPGLNPCGVNIRNISNPNPEIIRVLDGEWPNWKVLPNWLTNDTPIGPGNYTLWVASGDPNDQGFCTCTDGACSSSSTGNSFGKACEKGVCALTKCPQCLTTSSITFTLVEPEIVVDPIDEVIRCCCPGADCGSVGGMNKFWLNGTSGGNYGKELKIWVFAPGQVGGKNYLINPIPVYCDSKFSYEMNWGILEPNGISLCQLSPGSYDVIVQAPGNNGIFDVRLEYPESNGDRYVLTTLPTTDSRLFLLEGKNALFGREAMNSLIQGIDAKGIDDIYGKAQLIIKDKSCEGNLDFTADRTEGNAPLNVTFTDLSKVTGVQWSWSANGVQFSTVHNPSYTFTTPGKYTIKFDVFETAGGIPKTMVRDWYINVFDAPTADFTYSPTNPNVDQSIQFIDKSTGNPTSWQWMFGDGSSSPLQSPYHSYSKNGGYTVSLNVSDSQGRSTPVTKRIQVGPIPPTPLPTPIPLIADFNIANAGSKTIEFTDLSLKAISWQWNFGDGSISVEQNPVHEYPFAGRYYYVTLTVSDGTTIESVTKGLYS